MLQLHLFAMIGMNEFLGFSRNEYLNFTLNHRHVLLCVNAYENTRNDYVICLLMARINTL